jgi:hypothetical protein
MLLISTFLRAFLNFHCCLSTSETAYFLHGHVFGRTISICIATPPEELDNPQQCKSYLPSFAYVEGYLNHQFGRITMVQYSAADITEWTWTKLSSTSCLHFLSGINIVQIPTMQAFGMIDSRALHSGENSTKWEYENGKTDGGVCFSFEFHFNGKYIYFLLSSSKYSPVHFKMLSHSLSASLALATLLAPLYANPLNALSGLVPTIDAVPDIQISGPRSGFSLEAIAVPASNETLIARRGSKGNAGDPTAIDRE